MRARRLLTAALLLTLGTGCSEATQGDLPDIPDAAPAIDTIVEQPSLSPAPALRAVACPEVDHRGPGSSFIVVHVAANRGSGAVEAQVRGAEQQAQLAAGIAAVPFPISSYGSYPWSVTIDGQPVASETVDVGPAERACDIVQQAGEADLVPGGGDEEEAPTDDREPTFDEYSAPEPASCDGCGLELGGGVVLALVGIVLFGWRWPKVQGEVQGEVIEPTIDLVADLQRLHTFVDDLTDRFDSLQLRLRDELEDRTGDVQKLLGTYNDLWAQAMTHTDAYVQGVNDLAEPLGRLWAKFGDREMWVKLAGRVDFALQMAGPIMAVGKAMKGGGQKIIDALAKSKAAKGTAPHGLPPTKPLPAPHTGPGQTAVLPHTGPGQTQILHQPTGTAKHTGAGGLPPTATKKPAGSSSPVPDPGPIDPGLVGPAHLQTPAFKADMGYVQAEGAFNQLEAAIKGGVSSPEMAAKLHTQYTQGLQTVTDALAKDPSLWSKMLPEQAEFLRKELAKPKSERFWKKMLGVPGPKPGGVQTAINSGVQAGQAQATTWTQDLFTVLEQSHGDLIDSVATTAKQAAMPPGPPSQVAGVLDEPTSMLDALAAGTIKDPSFTTIGKAILNINDAPIQMLTSEYQTSEIKEAQAQFKAAHGAELKALNGHVTGLAQTMWKITELLGGPVPGKPSGATTPSYGAAERILEEKRAIYDEAAGTLAASDTWVPGETEDIRRQQAHNKAELEAFVETAAVQLAFDAGEVQALSSAVESLNDALYGPKGKMAQAASDLAHTLNGLDAAPENPGTACFFTAVRHYLLAQKLTLDGALAK